MTQRRIFKEFPSFPMMAVPELPDGWEDTSWHNDELPSYSSNGLQVFISADDGIMYIICDITDGETYWTTRDWADCVKFVEGFGK
jgi:hypothetical protein